MIQIVPDLSLQIVDLFDPYDQGGTVPLPYVVTIVNAGPSDAHAVVLEMTQSRIIGASIPANCVVVGSSVVMTCDFGTVPAGSTVRVQFDYGGMPITDTVFSVQGLVTTTDADPNLANNSTSQSTQLRAGASIRVSISDALAVVPMGYRTTYRVVVENVGSASHWDWFANISNREARQERKEVNVLNLFGYTGLATLAAASAGAKVTHVDASEEIRELGT